MKEKFQSFRQHLSDAPWFRFLMDKINTPMLYGLLFFCAPVVPYTLSEWTLSDALWWRVWLWAGIVVYVLLTLFTGLRALDVYDLERSRSHALFFLLLLCAPPVILLYRILPK